MKISLRWMIPVAAVLILAGCPRAGAPASMVHTVFDDKLTASDAFEYSFFGSSVSSDSGYTVIGAPGGPDESGAAYVFRRGAGAVWEQEAKLTAPVGTEGGSFGRSVSVFEDRALVGAERVDDWTGRAYVFRRGPNGSWTCEATLAAEDGDEDYQFGVAVALYGGTAVVAAPGADDFQGAVYVFETDTSGDWVQTAKLVSSGAQSSEGFAWSLGLNGNCLFVGAPNAEEDRGAVYVFERDSGGDWTETAQLAASDGQEYDRFGRSVSVHTFRAIVGASSADGYAGAAYVFERDSGGPWKTTATARLTASDGEAQDHFGWSVSINAVGSLGVAVVGACQADSRAGAAYVFQRTGSGWSQRERLTAFDAEEGGQEHLGSAVFAGGGCVLAGAPCDDGAGNEPDCGSAYIWSLY